MAAIAVVTGAFAVADVIGADARWLAALGRVIVRDGIPDGVPYAAAPTAGWENVPVLAELLFHLADGVGGDRGLQVAQVAAVATCFVLLARLLLHTGASDTGTAFVLMLVAAGAVSTFAVTRVQLFSLVLFPATLTLLHAEHRAPSHRVWLLVPLVALWSNLHGAVLAGVAVAGAYLLVDRVRRQPAVALGVTAAMLVALCMTPSLWRTPSYYWSVLENEAARRGEGLWAPLSTAPLDLLLVAAALSLLALGWRGRPAVWEWVALAGLAVLTLRTARAGIWLLLVAAVPAARGVHARLAVSPLLPRIAVAGGAVLVAVGLAHGPVATGASDELVRRAIRDAKGAALLAEPLLGEQVALAGGRVWLSNPLDAFSREDQALYLDWLAGTPRGDEALDRSGGLVLVLRDSDAERRLREVDGVRLVERDDRAAYYDTR